MSRLTVPLEEGVGEISVSRGVVDSRRFLGSLSLLTIIVSAVLFSTGSVDCYLGHLDVCSAQQHAAQDTIIKDKPNQRGKRASEKRLQVGLDASEAFRVEDAGGVFLYANGTRAPALEIVQDFGYDWIRLRVMVAPDGRYGLFQDLDYTIRMAKETKRLGFKLLLDFHYSHWWADGDNQWCPLSWRDKDTGTVDVETLHSLVFEHTQSVMKALEINNALPDAVQIGNEISAGFLWCQGKLTPEWYHQDEPTKEWVVLQELLDTAITAVKNVSALPKIMIHLDKLDKDWTVAWMKRYIYLGGRADIIGLSWYPMWHGTFQDLQDNIVNLNKEFPDLDVWVVETAYFWDNSCNSTLYNCTSEKMPYPCTEKGQFDFLQDLRRMLLQTPCKAVFYWGSHWTQPHKWFRTTANETWESVERRALFDRSGRALMGISGLVD